MKKYLPALIVFLASCSRVPRTPVPDTTRATAIGVVVAELRSRHWPVPSDLFDTEVTVADTCDSFFLLCTPYSAPPPCTSRVMALRNNGEQFPLLASACAHRHEAIIAPIVEQGSYAEHAVHELIHIWRWSVWPPAIPSDRTGSDPGHVDQRLWDRYGPATLEARAKARMATWTR